MSIRNMIREFIFENYMIGGNEEELGNDDSFMEKGIIDSTGILELIMFVEESWEIEVSDDEVVPDNFDSINKLCMYISSKSKVQASISD